MMHEPRRHKSPCRIRSMVAEPRYRPDMGPREFERMLQSAVPGELRARFAGAADNVLVHSILRTDAEDSHYVTYLELPARGEDPDAFEQRLSIGYVPPTGLGVAIRYQHEFDDPFLAGKSYQQLATAIKHEIDHDEGDEPVIGREFIERKLANEADRRLAELAEEYERKAAECPELAGELRARLVEQIPDEDKREFLMSLYSFTTTHDAGEQQEES